MKTSTLLGASLIASSLVAAGSATADTLAYVGTYTGGKSQGIYVFRVEKPGGAARFAPLGLAAASASPSFLAIDAARRLVFAVNETDTFNGQPGGAVSAFSVDPASGKLTLINQQPSMGTSPCHLLLDPTGKCLVVANYSSGSVAVFPVAANGRLGAPSAVVQHAGHSVDPERQQGPHAHCVTFSPDGRFVFICDLGLDRVVGYRLDAAAGTLTAVASAGGAVKAGGGPRHLVFGVGGKFAYVLNEMTATVTTFTYDAAAGHLTELQMVSALPADVTSGKSGAEIAVHPSGRWLYSSNRGHNSLARFTIDPVRGTLTFAGTEPTGGRTPRHFALLPGGRQLVAANQDSDTLQLFDVDAATGKLSPAGAPIDAPKPVCVEFLDLAR